MGTNQGKPQYYLRTYERWYRWFSYIYDPFMRIMCFISNGGFGGERRIREHIIEWVDPIPGEKILDLCSGTGTLTIMIAERLSGDGEVAGLEICPSQLRVARKKKQPVGLTFIEGDAQNIPFPDGYFDKGVIFGALHEMPREVRHNVLAEACRVCKPGGRFTFFEHNKPGKKWVAILNDFFERFNPEFKTYKDLLKCGLTNEIKDAGFAVLKRSVVFLESSQIVLAERRVENRS